MEKTILIVDDFPSTHMFIGTLLKMRGFNVITSTNKYSANRVLVNESVDLVLLDSTLSGENITWFCGRIRDISKASLLLMTNGTERIGKMVLMKNKAIDFIVQPFGVEELISRIAEMIEVYQEKSNEDLQI